jgi:hypothetical protein
MTIMRLATRLTLTAVVAAISAALAPTAGAATTTLTGTLSAASSSRTNTVDISAPSVCGNSPVPQVVGNGPYHFDATTFGSTFGSACVTVTVNSATGQGVLVTAYAIGTDYVSSPGSVIGMSGDCMPNPDATSFSFTSPANGFVLVVEECASGTGGTYSVSVETTTTAAALRGLPTVVRSRVGATVRWRPASELGVVAYNVYREVNGRRVRANIRQIAAGRRAYAFVDRSALRHARVRYWIQAVRADGSRAWLGHTRIIRS